MALAYIRFERITSDNAVFSADIGTNKYYRYVIGSEFNDKNELKQIQLKSYISDIYSQSYYNALNSQFKIQVPVKYFSDKNRYIQLYSFSEKNGKGPAISNIDEVLTQYFSNDDIYISSSIANKTMSMSQTNSVNFNKCRHVGFSFSEADVNTNNLTNTVIEVAKLLTPIAISTFENLISKDNTQDKNSFDSKSVINIVNLILDYIKDKRPDTANTVNLNDNIGLKTAVTKSLINNRTQYSFAKVTGIDDAAIIGLITTIAPAAMKLLEGIIGPLAQQAPKIMEIVYDNPVKLINAINESKLQLKHEEDTNIQNLLAETNKGKAQEQLLKNAASAQVLSSPKSISFSAAKSEKVKLTFNNNNPIVINGKQKYVYSRNNNINLIYDLTVSEIPPNKPIPKSIIHLIIKDSINLKEIFNKKIQLKETLLNNKIEVLLDKEELRNFPVNSDLLVSAVFKWRDNDNKIFFSNNENISIYLMDEYILSEIKESVNGETPLIDMNKYSSFWNNIWEGKSAKSRRWEANFDVKYYMYFNYKKDSNGRIETKMKYKSNENPDDESKLELEAKIKSGMELSAVELNKLISEISNHNLLTESQLKAIQSDDLSKRYNLSADGSLRLKGKKNEVGSLWVYPEFSIQKMTLFKLNKINENGQVTEVISENIYFPIPYSVHFLGLKSSLEKSSDSEETSSGDTSDNEEKKDFTIDGYIILFDKKVKLIPVDLIPLKDN